MRCLQMPKPERVVQGRISNNCLIHEGDKFSYFFSLVKGHAKLYAREAKLHKRCTLSESGADEQGPRERKGKVLRFLHLSSSFHEPASDLHDNHGTTFGNWVWYHCQRNVLVTQSFICAFGPVWLNQRTGPWGCEGHEHHKQGQLYSIAFMSKGSCLETQW